MAGAILPIASAFYFLFAPCSMKVRDPWRVQSIAWKSMSRVS